MKRFEFLESFSALLANQDVPVWHGRDEGLREVVHQLVDNCGCRIKQWKALKLQPKLSRMAPKQNAKRKASDSVEGGDNGSASSSKKTKVDPTDNAGLAPNGQPTNKVLPVHISFPAKPSGTFRIAAFNVCGLATSLKKGFKSYYEAEDADILVLSETKVNNEPVDPALKARYPYSYWSISAKKGYAGLAVLAKKEPISVTKTLPGHPDPASVKGRIITLEYEHSFVIGTYVVNAGTGLKTLDAKNEWNKHFEAYIRELDQKKPVIWCGDLNVAPTEIDLANPKTNWNKTPGYTEAETTAFRNILEPSESAPEGSGKFVDVWRSLHPDDRHYTYFSYRFNCRMKGLGWRLDMFVLSERLQDKVKMCEIRSDIYGASDHCPIVLEIDEQAI